jgi:FkbM family methyltransferase
MIKKSLRRALKKLPVNFLQHLRLEVDYVLGFGSGTGSGEIGMQEELNFLKQIARTDIKVIFDVGANEGKWAHAAEKVFPKSTIFSFEPNPEIFQKLKESKLLASRMSAFMLALGSTNEFRTLNYNPAKPLIASLVNSESMYSLNNENVRVEVMRLDDFVSQQRVPVPDFIKIDVEGWELEVLLGLGSLLSEVSYIQFEISEGTLVANSSFSKIQTVLLENGFRIFRHSPIGLIEVQFRNVYNENFRTSNYLAVNETKVK